MMSAPISVTVSQVNNYIKRIMDSNPSLSDICVSGELSNVKVHFSGHIYMTLKDEASSIRTVMFKGDTFSLRFKPENGMKVLVCGRISVYERDGQYQLYAKSIEPDGVGALYTAYEQLKSRLESEGLFSPEHKKPLPRYPEAIAVVTAKTGAAIRDILNILKRRYPIAEVRVFPVLVQGEHAAGQIAEAISYINKHKLADVIIVGRGGGSIEDLWAFNEEILARSVYASEIPVISAVGHETDFTICDFVADLRAPTPSAAAELAVPSAAELLSKISSLSQALRSNLIHSVEKQKTRLKYLENFFAENKFFDKIDDKRMLLDDLTDELKSAYTNIIKEKNNRLEGSVIRLNAQNPLKLLMRGFSIAKSGDKILKSTKNIKIGDKIILTLSDGEIGCRADSIYAEKNYE